MKLARLAACSCADSLRLPIVPGLSPTSARSIRLQLGPVTVDPELTATADDAYSLTVDADHELITLTGPTSSGVFYAAQTVVNLAFPDGHLPTMTVRDWPRFV